MDITIRQDVIDNFRSRLHEPWSLYSKSLNRYKVVDGYLMHVNAHTRVGGMTTQSDLFTEYIDIMLNNLHEWHEYTLSNDLLYTLIASNLLSYYCSEGMLPWEDDIDISVNVKTWKFLKNIYDELPIANDIVSRYPDVCKIFKPKHIPGTSLYLCRCQFPGKMKVVNHERFTFYDKRKSPSGMRGIDISCAIPYGGAFIESFWAYRGFFPVCPGPGDWMSGTECPEVIFSGVVTRAIQRDYAFSYLVSRYGTKWDAMIQPRLIDKSRGHIPCKLQNKSGNPAILKLIKHTCK